MDRWVGGASAVCCVWWTVLSAGSRDFFDALADGIDPWPNVTIVCKCNLAMLERWRVQFAHRCLAPLAQAFAPTISWIWFLHRPLCGPIVVSTRIQRMIAKDLDCATCWRPVTNWKRKFTTLLMHCTSLFAFAKRLIGLLQRNCKTQTNLVYHKSILDWFALQSGWKNIQHTIYV